MNETIDDFEKNLDKTPIETLPNESREKIAKDLLLGILEHELMENLTSQGTSEAINRIMGNMEASASLAEDLKVFAKILVNQELNAKPGNSAEEILECTSMCLFAYLKRVKDGKESLNNEKVIKESYSSVVEYLHLLISYPEFAKAELGGRFGFLKGRISDEELFNLTSTKFHYVELCKKMIEYTEGGERATKH